jgi:hypothetical protein
VNIKIKTLIFNVGSISLIKELLLLLLGLYRFCFCNTQQKLKCLEMIVTDLSRLQEEVNKIVNSDNTFKNTYLPVCYIKTKDNII